MESCLTKAVTIIALTCFLVVGAAVASILGRQSMGPARVALPAPAVMSPVSPVANREAKQDRLTVVSLATAAFEPRQSPAISEPLRQAFAATTPADVEAAKAVAALPGGVQREQFYWPAVESALRAVARKIHATRQTDAAASAAQLDPDSPEVQQLKSAAMPLLFQLREDQKEEVRKLARIIGLDKIASAI